MRGVHRKAGHMYAILTFAIYPLKLKVEFKYKFLPDF